MFQKKYFSIFKQPIVILVLIWLVLTAINLNKAYHIDDTFHLQASQYLQKSPLEPMSGLINWGNSPTPMYEHNQPPLFFYLLALTQKIFGNSEIVAHLLLSIFTFLALYFFNKLIEIFNVKNKVILLLLFGFCPAFIVNQNIMTDVPILAISLGTMYFLCKGLQKNATVFQVIASVLLSVGLLIKYSLVPLFFVMFFTFLWKRNYRKMVVLFIPISVLILWSIWNFLEFDAVHLLGRRSGLNPKKPIVFLGTLGAISFFIFSWLYYYFPKKIIYYLCWIFVLIFTISVPLVYFGYINEISYNRSLNFIFIGNGILIWSVTFFRLIQYATKKGGKEIYILEIPLLLYVIGFSLFIAVLAPFNATRHILLIIPILLLLNHRLFEVPKSINNLAVVITVVIGLLLGVSDWIYADFYRKSASKIKITNQTTWSVGHWGWQWYSKKAGMNIFSLSDTLLVQKNNNIVFPKDIAKQYLPKTIKLDTVTFITEPSTPLTFFSGKKFASMYNSFLDKPAWQLSNSPIDTIFVCKVVEKNN